MKRYGQPQIIVTDKLRSYGAVVKAIGNDHRQETGRWINNRVENSHLPFRRRERAMLRFRQMRCLQKFVAVHSSVHNHFNQERALYSKDNFKLSRTAAQRNYWSRDLYDDVVQGLARVGHTITAVRQVAIDLAALQNIRHAAQGV